MVLGSCHAAFHWYVHLGSSIASLIQLFPSASPRCIVGLSSWPWHYWKCTFMRSTAKSSTSVLFAQWPSSQQTAPWLTWPASIQQSLTRLLSEYFVITRSSPLLVSSTTASTFHLSWFFLFPFFLLLVPILVSEELPLCLLAEVCS